jgi:Tol biopolymer transport system component
MRQSVGSGESEALFWKPGNSTALDILGKGQVVFDTRAANVNLREVNLKDAAPASADRILTRGNSSDRQPVYSRDGEQVAFSSNWSGNLDLWEVWPNTGAVRRITDDPAHDWDPAYTPDGKQLVWSSNRSGVFEIWIAESDGSGARQITHDGVDAENPTVTSDGEWVVYNSGNLEKPGVWKIRQDRTEATRLVSGPTLTPEVSPDGQYVAFLSSGRPNSVMLLVVRLTDGSKVPFEIPIRIVNPGRGAISRMRWMPDGRATAFLGQDEDGVNGIFVQDFSPGRDTSDSRRRLGGFDRTTTIESFGISPDGTRMTLAGCEQLSSIMLAEGVPSIFPPRRAP